MNRFRGLIVAIFFLLIAEKLEFINGYQWISIKPGEPLPTNTVSYDDYSTRYIGRARHFDEILPAEVHNNGSAFIWSCNKMSQKEQYEILTTSEKCQWQRFSTFDEIDETVVRIGTAWNGEPTYVGAFRYDSYHRDMAIIYLAKLNFYRLTSNTNNYYDDTFYLSCTPKPKWIDTAAVKLPNNTVSGGKSEDGYDIYVAKLKRGCNIVGGQAVPEIGTATAFFNNGSSIEAAYCQVLVDEFNEYGWVTASDGEIPDYAVVSGKSGNEVEYMARFNKTLGYVTHSEALRDQLDYEILVAADPLV